MLLGSARAAGAMQVNTQATRDRLESFMVCVTVGAAVPVPAVAYTCQDLITRQRFALHSRDSTIRLPEATSNRSRHAVAVATAHGTRRGYAPQQSCVPQDDVALFLFFGLISSVPYTVLSPEVRKVSH